DGGDGGDGGGGGGGGGVIQGTASEAVLVALLAARERAGPGRHAVYASSQAHSSVTKAAMIAGLGREAVRTIGVDSGLAMRPELLEERIAADRAAGMVPAMCVATVGTTSTTAIDPLGPIGAVCAREGVWLHVDAAFAGAACVCPEMRWIIDGVERADSFNFNPHKWLLTTFDCSAMWLADRRPLVNAVSITPEYLRNAASAGGGVIDYRDWQIPLGRRFRALKLWFVLRHYGAEGLRAYIREHVRLAGVFEGLVRSDGRFEVVLPPPAERPRATSLVCFRHRGGDGPGRAVLERVNASGAAFLTHSVVPLAGEGDRLILRMAIGGAATGEAHVRAAWGAIAAAAGG
ncbi:MAG: aminotransferase class V-fold PLP-dependent enzyme, partial [Phycisphaerales bacterium]|nr:aminotransferase class V-fold PLP-dependent enzyme [Phycisphaerales bacterium]